MFHDRTKHIEVNYHLVQDNLVKKMNCTPFTPSSEYLANILTKTTLSSKLFDKIGITYTYALA